LLHLLLLAIDVLSVATDRNTVYARHANFPGLIPFRYLVVPATIRRAMRETTATTDLTEGGLKTIIHTTESGVRKLIDMVEPTVEIRDRIATTKEGKIDTGRGAGMTTVDDHAMRVVVPDVDPVGIGNMNRHELLEVAALRVAEARAGTEWTTKASGIAAESGAHLVAGRAEREVARRRARGDKGEVEVVLQAFHARRSNGMVSSEGLSTWCVWEMTA
jgi:hypothetical protein